MKLNSLTEDKRVNKVSRMQKRAMVFKWKSLEGEQQTMKNYTLNPILNKFRNLRVVLSQEWNHTLDMGFDGSLGMQIYLPVEEKNPFCSEIHQ